MNTPAICYTCRNYWGDWCNANQEPRLPDDTCPLFHPRDEEAAANAQTPEEDTNRADE